MTVITEHQWRADGSPWHLALPILQIATALAEIPGCDPKVDIGTIGDEAHLSADPPEDHTPYSQTGWPIPTPYSEVTALDYSGPGYITVGQFWLRERRAGRLLCIKYLNLNGVHYSFQPGEADRSSTDWKGHVHLSIRSDWCHTSIDGPLIPHPIPTVGPITPGDTVFGNLTLGAQGWETRSLQGALNAQDVRDDAGNFLAEDGVFGPRTEQAVIRFQHGHGLTPDGEAGPKTRTFLYVGHL